MGCRHPRGQIVIMTPVINPTAEESLVNYETMSHDEIHQHLADLEQQRVLALNTLSQIKKKGKFDLADTIRGMIAEQGFSVEDILPLLTSGRRRSQRARTRVATPSVSTPAGAYYVDPEDDANIYFRGAIPNWMKTKMQSQGLDPSNKDDRNTFKANYLRRVAA